LGKPTRQQQRRRALRLETLEPRLLLSADLSYSAGAGVLDAALRFSDDGTALQLIDRETLAELASTSLGGTDPGLDAAPAVSIELTFGAGADSLTLWGGEFGTVAHRAAGSDTGSVELVHGATSIAVDYAGLEGIVDVTGAAERSFVNETLVQQQIRLAHDGQLNGLYDLGSNATGGFASMRLLEPTESLIVRAGDEGDTLLLDGAKPAAVADLVFEGGAGVDTLAGPASHTLWTLRGEDEGELSDAPTGQQIAQFSGIENLSGSHAAEDTFVIDAAGSLSGLIDGGSGGFDELIIIRHDTDESVLAVPDAAGAPGR
jgi:hypothetical protein